MANANLEPVLRYLHTVLAREQSHQMPDRQLLELYRLEKSERAFELLIQRHGPLVLGVCRRVLGHNHDAEDVFQATFLVLATKAHVIRKERSIGSWLFGVAHRLALQAKRAAVRRQRHEREGTALRATTTQEQVDRREDLQVLDEELQQLSELHRAPLLLYYLGGWTQDEAARQLGWSFGTFRRRLEQGRESLRNRLVRRGLTLSTGLTIATPTRATSPMPTALVGSLVQAVRLLQSGRAGLAGIVSPKVIALTKKGMPLMLSVKLKTGAVLLLALGLLGTGFAGYGSLSAESPRAGKVNSDDALADDPKLKDQNPHGNDLRKEALPRNLDQRLAMMEKQLEALTLEVQAIRRELKKPESANTLRFSLKHTSATNIASALREMFGNRDVVIGVDERSNAIVIQASEMDIMTCRRILTTLDVREKGPVR